MKKTSIFVVSAIMLIITTFSCRKDNSFTQDEPIINLGPDSLAVAINNGYANRVFVTNTSDAKICSFILQNQNRHDSVKVSKIFYGLKANPSNLTLLKTSEVSGNGNVPVQPDTSNIFNVDFILAPGAVKVIDFFVNIGSQSPDTLKSTFSVESIEMPSNVTKKSNLVTGQIMTVTTEGTITPTFVVSSSSSSQYIACGNTGITDGTVHKFNFHNNSFPRVITELKFVSEEVNPQGITLIKVNGTSAPVIGGTAYLTGLNINVPQGGSGANIDVHASYAAIGISGYPSGTLAKFKLTYVKSVAGGITSTLNCNVSTNTMKLVGSKPIPKVDFLPHGGLLLNAVNKLTSMTIDVDPTGDISLSLIQTGITHSGINNFSLSSLEVRVGGVVIPGSSVNYNSSNGLLTINLPAYLRSAGTSTNIDVYAMVGGTSSGSPKINSVYIVGGFKWTDVAGNGASQAEDGLLVYNFPQNSYVLYQ